jgi:hypothetical protein
MSDETKVPVAPEAAVAEPLIDSRRAEVEKLVQAENETFPEAEVVPVPVAEPEAKPAEVIADPVEKIKQSVQKRIDKVVAQKKSVEEENAELKAELERLKANVKPETTPAPADAIPDREPTIQEVKDYIKKMRAEGNVDEEIAAMDYLVDLKKKQAIAEVQERETKAQAEARQKTERELAEWTALQRDYVKYDAQGNPDAKSDLTLANQNGLLYKTALSLYNDKELHAEHYNDPNVMHGFRRAVADAYRELHEQGLIKSSPKGEQMPQRINRQVLADPSAEIADDTPAPAQSLSDADKVREEIKNRNKNRYIRPIS